MSLVTIPNRFRVRRRTAASWDSLNEVLLDSEIGLESDTTWPIGGGRKFKIGDGVTAWNSLDYAAPDVPFVGGGAGLQVGYVRTESTTAVTTGSTIPLDNTIPQNTEGVAYASLDTTITPTAATSLLEIEVSIPLISASTTANIIGALFRDSGVNAIAACHVAIESVDRARQMLLRVVVAAGSTSATTFKLRWGTSTGSGALMRNATTTAFYGGVLKATMTVKEIRQ